MAKVVVSAPAWNDIAAILTELAFKAGVSVASRYDERFKTIFTRLAEYPRSGAPRPALGPETRIAVAPPYVVIHESNEADDTVVVLRVVHGSRDVNRRLLARA